MSQVTEAMGQLIADNETLRNVVKNSRVVNDENRLIIKDLRNSLDEAEYRAIEREVEIDSRCDRSKELVLRLAASVRLIRIQESMRKETEGKYDAISRKLGSMSTTLDNVNQQNAKLRDSQLEIQLRTPMLSKDLELYSDRVSELDSRLRVEKQAHGVTRKWLRDSDARLQEIMEILG